MAISPTDPNAIVIGWRLFPDISSNHRVAGFSYSHDGGITFTAGGSLTPPPGWPADTAQTDPVMGADSNGTFFYWSEPFRPDSAEWVYPSFDNGVTWQTPTPVQSPINGDKDWMVIDNTGTIGDGHIYGGWNDFSLGGQCFTRSIDGGASFSPTVRIADSGGTQWMLHFAVGPDGELYAAWRNYSQDAIFITKSNDAKDPAVTPTFDAFGPGGQNGLDIKLDNSNDPGFLDINPDGFHQIYIGVDQSNGPHRGWVYCIKADNRRDESDIYFARSSDGGLSWKNNIRINDDTAGTIQWMPTMSIAPDGRIDAVWYDTRNDPNGNTPHSEMFYSFSIDGGSTWAVNRRISESFDTTIGFPNQNKIGDYIDCRSDLQKMNFIYSATYNGGQDVWFMTAKPAMLTVNNLIAGEIAQFSVTNLTPNKPVWLAASITGISRAYIPQLNAYIGLALPFKVGNTNNTDANGNATWDINVPDNSAGQHIWVQAIQFENGTNIIDDTIAQ